MREDFQHPLVLLDKIHKVSRLLFLHDYRDEILRVKTRRALSEYARSLQTHSWCFWVVISWQHLLIFPLGEFLFLWLHVTSYTVVFIDAVVWVPATEPRSPVFSFASEKAEARWVESIDIPEYFPLETAIKNFELHMEWMKIRHHDSKPCSVDGRLCWPCSA